MDKTKHSPEQPETSGSGIARDVRQVRAHSQATAAELREFLAETRGRSPQEVLGMVAGSSLVRSIALAAVGTVLVLAVGTIVPWLTSGETSDGKPSANAAAAVPEETTPADEPGSTMKARDPSTAGAANPKPSPADAKKAVDVMGLGDTKAADPKSNPLEKNVDKLLDGLE